MNQVLVYGRPSFTDEYLIELISNNCKKVGLDFKFKLISEVGQFIEKDIYHIPAVEYQGEIREIKNISIKDFATEISDWLIKTESKRNLN